GRLIDEVEIAGLPTFTADEPITLHVGRRSGESTYVNPAYLPTRLLGCVGTPTADDRTQAAAKCAAVIEGGHDLAGLPLRYRFESFPGVLRREFHFYEPQVSALDPDTKAIIDDGSTPVLGDWAPIRLGWWAA